MVAIGDKIKIAEDNDNENYAPWRNKILTVEAVYESVEDNPLYDEEIGGQMVDCKDFPYSLYEYEFEVQ